MSSISLCTSQLYNHRASESQKSQIDEHAIVPRKATGWLTDMQLRKIGLVALAIIFTVGPILAGVLTGGAGLVVGVMFGLELGVLGGLLAYFNWPKADYQTPEGAAIIRKDLQKKSLDDLHNNYSFGELAYYGYISKTDADKMQSLYKKMPHYHNQDRFDNYPKLGLSFSYPSEEHNFWGNYWYNSGIHSMRQSIEREFNTIRSRSDFILKTHHA